MKKLLLLLLPILFTACQSKSYYNAMNTNEQRFDGWQEENAIFLVETNDKIQLLIDLSELAQKDATLKSTFQTAEQMETSMDDLQTFYDIEATIHRVKLASALSEESDKILQKLESVSADNFDDVYLRYINSEIKELDRRVKKYQDEGHNERIRNLADRVKEAIEDLKENNQSIS